MAKRKRSFETGPGFIAAIPCAKCLHTRCGHECACECAKEDHLLPFERVDLAKAGAEIKRRRWK